MNDFTRALFDKAAAPEILVYFRGRPDPVTYTAGILELLKTDPAVEAVVDPETAEIIFSR